MYRLGVDLGGTNIVAGIVDDNYKIVNKMSVKTKAGRSSEEIADDIAYISKKIIDEENLKFTDFISFGIGSPGVIDTLNGIVVSAGNLKFENVPLTQLLKERMGIEFHIENDANVAAFGEYIAGAGKGSNTFILLTLGTGVGSGIILNGEIFKSRTFMGGELGHIIIDFNGDECVCGGKGCFEKYASASALINQTKAKMLSNKNSLMWNLVKDIDAVDGKTAFTAAKKGDLSAISVVDKYTEYLAIGITNAIRIFDPEIICIGGGISNEKENLLSLVQKHMLNYNLKILLENTEICIAELKNDAGIIGAAFLDKTKNKIIV